MEKAPHKPGLPRHSKSQNITKEKIKRFLPKGAAHAVTDEIMNAISNMEKDTGILQEYMEESLLGNMGVLNKVKVDLPDYINAIKYVVLKADLTNRQAWEIVFPDKMERLEKLKEELGDKVNIDSHVSNYNKSKIVVELDTQMRLHASILYAPYFHEAMMKKVNLMRGIGANPTDRVSPTVQLAAAIAVTDKTQMPEDNSIELKLGMSDDVKSVQEGLMHQIGRMADAQIEMMKSGRSISDVQRIGISTDSIIEADIDE